MINRRLFTTAAAAVLFSCFISGAVSACGKGGRHGGMEESDTYRAVDFSESDTEERGTSAPPETDTASFGVSSSDETEKQNNGTDGSSPDESSKPTQNPHLEGTVPISPGTSSAAPADGNTTAGTGQSGTTEGKNEEASASGQTSVTQKETDGTTEAEETTASQAQQVQYPLQPEDYSVEFFFKVPGYTGKNYYDRYLADGFVPVESLSRLSEYCRDELLTLKGGNKSVNYIITPRGLFDDMASRLARMDEKAAGGAIGDIYDRDSFLYEELGLDYQTYYSRGLSIFKIKKIGDVGDKKHSVYAVYYYSYEDSARNAKVNSVVEQAVAGFSGNDYDKILSAYDYICDNTIYYDNADSYEPHSAYGALVSGKAVCEGYAKAYKLLLDKMGIANYIVINSTHAWNVVSCDGSWYFVDVTNGDFNGCYAYFMLGGDVLCNAVDMTIDNYIFSAEAIAYYGYTDGSNTDENTLASSSVPERVISYR